MKEISLSDNAELFMSPVSTLWFDDNGILYSVFKNVPRTMQACKERTTLIKSLKKDKLVCSVMEVSHSGPIDRDARELLKKKNFLTSIKLLLLSVLHPWEN